MGKEEKKIVKYSEGLLMEQNMESSDDKRASQQTRAMLLDEIIPLEDSVTRMETIMLETKSQMERLGVLSINTASSMKEKSSKEFGSPKGRIVHQDSEIKQAIESKLGSNHISSNDFKPSISDCEKSIMKQKPSRSHQSNHIAPILRNDETGLNIFSKLQKDQQEEPSGVIDICSVDLHEKGKILMTNDVKGTVDSSTDIALTEKIQSSCNRYHFQTENKLNIEDSEEIEVIDLIRNNNNRDGPVMDICSKAIKVNSTSSTKVSEVTSNNDGEACTFSNGNELDETVFYDVEEVIDSNDDTEKVNSSDYETEAGSSDNVALELYKEDDDDLLNMSDTNESVPVKSTETLASATGNNEEIIVSVADSSHDTVALVAVKSEVTVTSVATKSKEAVVSIAGKNEKDVASVDSMSNDTVTSVVSMTNDTMTSVAAKSGEILASVAAKNSETMASVAEKSEGTGASVAARCKETIVSAVVKCVESIASAKSEDTGAIVSFDDIEEGEIHILDANLLQNTSNNKISTCDVTINEIDSVTSAVLKEYKSDDSEEMSHSVERAVSKGNYDIVFSLVNSGAQVTFKSILEAVKNDFTAIFDILFHTGVIKTVVQAREVLLEAKSAYVAVTIIETWPNALKGEESVNLLLGARNEEVLSVFINGGGKRSADAAIRLMLRDGHSNLLSMFLNHINNVNCVICCGQTPLHLAAEYNDAESISVLLKHGADVNCTDRLGNMPIHRAVAFGCKEAVKILSDAGAICHPIKESVNKMSCCPNLRRKKNISIINNDNLI